MTTEYETHEHDVLIIGAGGAGLRAALGALAQGAKVGVVCKSLLGKAHTVMAEGGIAAAMANVDLADDWRTHFRDTMRGGKLLNNWRMAQIHAQEAPERVRELEQWGALFDRTEDGQILQRAFGGHTFRRLCHVGDRTGLEMIRTLQDRGVQLGIDVYMECTISRLLKDGDRVAGAFGYWREQGRFVVFRAKSIVMATGGIGKAWKITSNSWEYTGDGMALAYDAGAELMDMEFVQFHPTGHGVASGRAGDSGHRGGSRRRRSSPQQIGPALHGEIRSEKDGAFHTRRGGACDLYGSTRGPWHGTWRSLSRYLAKARRLCEEKAAQHVSPIQGTRRCRHHQGADGSGTNLPLHDGRHSRGCGNREVIRAGTVCRWRGGSGAAWRQPAGRQFSFGPARLRPPGGVGSRRARETNIRPRAIDSGQIEEAAREMLAPFERKDGESPYAIHRDLQETMQNLVGIFRNKEDLIRALEELEKLKERAGRVSVEGSRLFNPGWHLAQDLKAMLTVSEAVTRSALAREESRGAHSRIDHPGLDATWGTKNNVIVRQGSAMTLRQSAVPELPDDLKQLVAEEK